MATRVVAARLPSELAAEVSEEALRAWIALEAKRHKLALEAVADVEAGHVIDHAKVEVWAKNLSGPRTRTTMPKPI